MFSKKITSLTDEQQKQLTVCYNEALVTGRSCEPINHEKVESIITKFYARIGKAKPLFLYFASPMQCIKAAEVVKSVEDWSNVKVDLKKIEATKPSKTTIDMMLSNRFGGQQWISWNVYYKFAQSIGVEYDKNSSELLDEWVEEGKNLHWWFPFDDVVFVSERPIRLTVNETGNLHNESVMAIEYTDGWGMFYLNGVKVPEYLVVTPAEKLDMEFFKTEQNADVRTEFVRKYGIERMLEMGKKIDSYESYDQEEQPWWWKSEYELWDMAVLFSGIEYQPYLKMKNQTTGIWHVEALSPNCHNLVEGLRERFGGRDMKIVAIA
jgi:hypothetical protein